MDHDKVTFATQGRIYIDRLKTRSRCPIKPATIAAFESYLRNHVVPRIGDVELESFNNGALKAFVQTLIDKKLSPKSITEISAFTRSIVTSAVDADGNQLYPRTWNLNFVDAPPISKQSQPTVSKEFLQTVLNNAALKVRNRVLIAVLALTGLRIGELLALKLGPDPLNENTIWEPNESMVRVRKSVWRGKLQAPKSAAAVRDLDLCTAINTVLQEFTCGKRHGEFLFCTRHGKPLEQSHVRNFILNPAGIPGAHSLRRLRVSHLREMGCNEDILRQWGIREGPRQVKTSYR